MELADQWSMPRSYDGGISLQYGSFFNAPKEGFDVTISTAEDSNQADVMCDRVFDCWIFFLVLFAFCLRGYRLKANRSAKKVLFRIV